jgi:hypothetical protein
MDLNEVVDQIANGLINNESVENIIENVSKVREEGRLSPRKLKAIIKRSPPVDDVLRSVSRMRRSGFSPERLEAIMKRSPPTARRSMGNLLKAKSMLKELEEEIQKSEETPIRKRRSPSVKRSPPKRRSMKRSTKKRSQKRSARKRS